MALQADFHIEQVAAAVHDALAAGLQLGCEHILTVSNQHVPLEYGDLQGSGVTSMDDGSLTGAVSYNTPYAARQHEELSWRHDPGRTAKFLENAANSEAGQVGQIIAETARSHIGG